MSGQLQERPAYTVVRCSGLSEDGMCRREQAIETHDGGRGVAVASSVSDATATWLSSFGWRRQSTHWLCPFCAAKGDLS